MNMSVWRACSITGDSSVRLQRSEIFKQNPIQKCSVEIAQYLLRQIIVRLRSKRSRIHRRPREFHTLWVKRLRRTRVC